MLCFLNFITIILINLQKNDPANFIQVQKWTPELKNIFLIWGAYQPKEHELPNGEYPKDPRTKRSFHSSWYVRKLMDNTYITRDWLTYSLKLNKLFCLHCILFGKNASSAWTKDGYSYWKNGLMSIVKHETTSEHIMASLKIKLKENCLPLLPSLVEEQNRQVALNREIVKQLIEITIFLARHSLSFRGHNENWENNLKGNFKDMVILLAQHSPVLSVHISQLKSKRKKENSFISWDRQNLLIESISQYISSVIKAQVVAARNFSICIDSTFDVSHKEQLSFIVRYVFAENIQERLIAIIESPCTTGEALFELFKSVMERCNLDWKKNLVGQAYDGAANMRGSYSGLQARIIKLNPRALYVWCHAHRLNLVVLSAVGSCKEAVNLFGNLEKLYTFISCSKKRSDIYRQKQREIYPNKQVRAIKRVGTTRWMSTSYALSTVLETLEAILNMFNEIKIQEGVSDYKTGAECNGLLYYFQSSQFLLTAFLFKRIFDILEPTSKVLQSRDLDVLTAVDFLKKMETKISLLRSDEEFTVILNETKNYSEEHFGDFEINIEQMYNNRHRKRKVPRCSDELAVDEPFQDVVKFYKISVYFKTLDIVLQQIREKFTENYISVIKDIGLLSLKRMNEISKVPQDAFVKICETYGLNQENVRNEYILFKHILKDLNLNLLMALPKKLHDSFENDSENDDDEIEEDIDFKNLGSLIKIFKIINATNLQPEFENLYETIKLSLTLPTSSCTVERSFSKLKIIKSRLRSTMEQNRLENLMIISCEHDIDIDISKVMYA